MKINYPANIFPRTAFIGGKEIFQNNEIKLSSTSGYIFNFEILNNDTTYYVNVELDNRGSVKRYSVSPTSMSEDTNKFIAAAFIYLENYDDTNYADLTLPNKIKLIYNNYLRKISNGYRRNNEEFVDKVYTSLTEQELSNSTETMITYFNVVCNINSFSRFEVSDRFFLFYKYFDFTKEDAIKIFTHIINVCFNNSYPYLLLKDFLDDIFKNTKKEFLFDLADALFKRYMFYYDRDKYYLRNTVQAFIDVFCQYECLSEKTAITVMKEFYSYESLLSKIVDYSFQHEYAEALGEIDESIFKVLNREAQKQYISYLIEVKDPKLGYRFANTLMTVQSSFLDYVWYKELEIPKEYAINEEVLYDYATDHKYKGAFLIYNHKEVSPAVIKSIPLSDLKILKSILLADYKDKTIEAIKSYIESKMNLKSINESNLISYLFFLKDFSLIEYGRIRNNIRIKEILGKNAFLRYDDLLSLYRTNNLCSHGLFPYEVKK